MSYDFDLEKQQYTDAFYELLLSLLTSSGGNFDLSAPRLTLIGTVKLKIDELQPQQEGVQFIDVNSENISNVLDLYINGLLDECAKHILQTAPKHIIIPTDGSEIVVVDNEDTTGYLKLPDDYIRFISFKLKTWLQEVTEPILTTDQKYKFQKYAATRGGLAKPVVVLNSIKVTNTPVKQIETLTLSGTSGTANIYCASLVKAITWNANGLSQTAIDFIALFAANWLVVGVVLTTDSVIDFAALSQSSLVWSGMTTAPNENVYACVNGGDIYKQTAGAGDFAALSQPSLAWSGMAAAPNGNIYACVDGGDIYMQTAGAGNFNALSQSSLAWSGMAAAPNGNIYACVLNGDIYMQTAGIGNFIALSQTSRDWSGMTATPDGDIYACVVGVDIYKQTAGADDFVAQGEFYRDWSGMASTPDGNIYACVDSGDIYMQTNPAIGFVALSQSSLAWSGITGAPNGNVYICVDSGDIYMQTNNPTLIFTANVAGVSFLAPWIANLTGDLAGTVVHTQANVPAIEGKRTLEYYSIPIIDPATTHEISKFLYIGNVGAEYIQANLTDALTWLCASKMLQIMGDITNQGGYAEKALEQVKLSYENLM